MVDIETENTSEALECLEELYELDYGFDGWKIDEIVQSSYTKQALLKAEKEHKALEIIKEKLVDVFKLYNCKTVEEYNQAQYRDCMLTEEEFNLLKDMLE